MKFLANENFPLASVRALRNIGLDVVSVEEESPGISDEEVLRRARDENRIIVTFDRDYGELVFHRRLSAPAGVSYLRFHPKSPLEAAEYVAGLTAGGMELEGRFTTTDRDRVRQRIIQLGED